MDIYDLTDKGRLFYNRGGFYRLYKDGIERDKKKTRKVISNRIWDIAKIVIGLIIVYLFKLLTEQCPYYGSQ
jgi:hypothetical protein